MKILIEGFVFLGLVWLVALFYAFLAQGAMQEAIRIFLLNL